MTAFIEHAVHRTSKDLRYFTQDFASERISDTGWCGSESHFSLDDIGKLLTCADEIRTSGDQYENAYTAKTFSRRFVVQKAAYHRAWDLMEDIVLGEITLTAEPKLQGGGRRIRSFRVATQRLWFWQPRRIAPPISENPSGEVPREWCNGTSIPEEYLALPILD